MRPPDTTELLLSKRLEPLSRDKIEIIRRVQDYAGVETFNEAEVRSYIIDPILRVLGCQEPSWLRAAKSWGSGG
jgi:hypothetical protein